MNILYWFSTLPVFGSFRSAKDAASAPLLDLERKQQWRVRRNCVPQTRRPHKVAVRRNLTLGKGRSQSRPLY